MFDPELLQRFLNADKKCQHNGIDMGNAIFNGACPICLEAEVARLREENRWIPVSEDLPKIDYVVWGCSARNDVYECYLDESGDWHIDDFYGKRINIVFWKEIRKPEPPKEVEQ